MASSGQAPEPGDFDPDELRARGHDAIEWVAAFLERCRDLPVLAQTQPGELLEQLPATAPEEPQAWEETLDDLDRLILPGITHWNHPRFFAYFANTASVPGIVGSTLAAALNPNAMLWRTSPAATELEQRVLQWLAGWVGLPDNLFGIINDTASTSSLCALAAARQAVPGYDSELGLASLPAPLRLYESDQAHSSIDKAALVLGLGSRAVRKIPTTPDYAMDPHALRAAIAEDHAAGLLPFCIVATAGTTSTTSIDPVDALAEIAEREGLWLHVLRAAFSLVPEYLRSNVGDSRSDSTPEEEPSPIDYMNYGIQLGRPFRALKLWMVMCAYGRRGIEARLRHHIDLAHRFAGWIDEHPDFERLAPTPLSTVCFRWRHGAGSGGSDGRELEPVGRDPWAEANERLMGAVNAGGAAFLSHTRLRGRLTLRLAVGNLRTTSEDVRDAWNALRREAEALD